MRTIIPFRQHNPTTNSAAAAAAAQRLPLGNHPLWAKNLIPLGLRQPLNLVNRRRWVLQVQPLDSLHKWVPLHLPSGNRHRWARLARLSDNHQPWARDQIPSRRRRLGPRVSLRQRNPPLASLLPSAKNPIHLGHQLLRQQVLLAPRVLYRPVPIPSVKVKQRIPAPRPLGSPQHPALLPSLRHRKIYPWTHQPPSPHQAIRLVSHKSPIKIPARRQITPSGSQPEALHKQPPTHSPRQRRRRQHKPGQLRRSLARAPMRREVQNSIRRPRATSPRP